MVNVGIPVYMPYMDPMGLKHWLFWGFQVYIHDLLSILLTGSQDRTLDRLHDTEAFFSVLEQVFDFPKKEQEKLKNHPIGYHKKHF